MKNIILAAMLLISISAKSQSKPDTIKVPEKYVMVKINRYGPFHKVKTDFIIVQDGKYYVNGKELKYIRHDENVNNTTAIK